jgi:hypothetical protein
MTNDEIAIHVTLLARRVARLENNDRATLIALDRQDTVLQSRLNALSGRVCHLEDDLERLTERVQKPA